MIRDKIVLFFFFALFLFVCYQIALIFSPFLKTMFWAVTIAIIVFPLHQLVSKRIPNTHIAAFVTTAVVVLVALPLGGFIVLAMFRQAVDLYDLARDCVSTGGVAAAVDWFRNFAPIRYLSDQVLKSEHLQEKLGNVILTSAQGIGTFATGQMTGIGKNLLFLVIQIILCIFFLFFIFRDGHRFYGFIYDFVPMEEKHKEVIFQKVKDTFSAVLGGQFLTAFVQGVLAGGIFLCLGIPLPLLLGFFTFLAAMVPIIGAGAVWVPVDIYLFATNSYGKGVILLILGLGGISLIDNIMKPILIGKKAKLPTLFLFLGIIGGLKLYGVLGLFLGPVILSVFFALIKIYQDEYKIGRNPFS